MSMAVNIARAALAAAAVIAGVQEYRVSTRDTQIEAAATLSKVWEQKFAIAQGIADENAAAVERIRADIERQDIVKAKAVAAERKRADALATKLKRIQNAPKSDDGPIAPVLRNALDGLRSDGDGVSPADPADADGGHKDQSGATGDQPGGHRLPDAAPAT